MIVCGIDPGPEKSGFVIYDTINKEIIDKAILQNEDFLKKMQLLPYPQSKSIHCYDVAIEYTLNFFIRTHYVGAETNMTNLWAGRFIQKALDLGLNCKWYHRNEIKTYLCGNASAGDPDVSMAVRDRFPATGGGKRPQIGTKKKPGPLFGIHDDIWSALAVAITYVEKED